jgi:hypothetical protein
LQFGVLVEVVQLAPSGVGVAWIPKGSFGWLMLQSPSVF